MSDGAVQAAEQEQILKELENGESSFSLLQNRCLLSGILMWNTV